MSSICRVPVDDRRSNPRHIPVLQLAAIQTEDRSQLGLVLNLSRSGMKLRRVPGLRVGQRVIVRLRNHDLEGTSIWQTADKVGIAFDSEMTEAELHALLTPLSDRTRAPRLSTRREIVVRNGALVTRAILHNVSPSGAMLEVALPATADPLLVLTLPAAGQVLGQIRWTDGERVGVLFSRALSLPDLAVITGQAAPESNQSTKVDVNSTEMAD